MKRLAFVIQRYGRGVNGGAETLCRQVAERLSESFSIEVLTTCARDYLTWADHFTPGKSTLRGVEVRRFPVARQRKVRAFGRFSQKIFSPHHTFAQEAEWMAKQGPDAPELFSHIQRHRDDYDLFVFFTYLYAPTFFGLPQVAEKSLLLPMAHDEAPLHLALFRPSFHLPRGLIFNTDEERRFVHETFRNEYIPWIVAGAGVDLPEIPSRPSPPGDYLLYLGRVDVEKGCRELFEFFLRHKKAHPGPLKLLLAGDVKMKLPSDGDIVPLGFVSTESKATLLGNAKALVVPSRLESLSLSTLEAWAAGRPVIANRGSRVLADHIDKSSGGWLYGGFKEFSRSLEEGMGRNALLAQRGRAGHRYVARHYSWDRILGSYTRFFTRMSVRAGGSRADRT